MDGTCASPSSFAFATTSGPIFAQSLLHLCCRLVWFGEGGGHAARLDARQQLIQLALQARQVGLEGLSGLFAPDGKR